MASSIHNLSPESSIRAKNFSPNQPYLFYQRYAGVSGADPTLFDTKSSIKFSHRNFDTGVMVVDLVVEPYIVFDYYDLSLRRE
jgi:hypothetical protein